MEGIFCSFIVANNCLLKHLIFFYIKLRRYPWYLNEYMKIIFWYMIQFKDMALHIYLHSLLQGIKFKYISPPSVNEIVEASAMDAEK